MHTDRYSDTLHKKFQTANPITNAFSVRLKLPHITKIHLPALVYEQEMRLGRPGQLACAWLSLAYFFHFASVPFKVIPWS